MASVPAQLTKLTDGGIIVLWEQLDGTTNTTGDAVQFPSLDLASVQMLGTFGGTAALQGSLVPGGAGSYETVKNLAGTAISGTAAAIFNFGSASDAVFFKPLAGTGVADVDIYAYFRPRI
jgi:hypothetical protein